MSALFAALKAALPEPAKAPVRRLVWRVAPPPPTDARPLPPPYSSRWDARAPSPWSPAGGRCNLCRWNGRSFRGPAHCEGAMCPRCGSLARDRFLLACLVARCPPRTLGARLWETSPRLGGPYRRAMGRWFAYEMSDYDQSAHAAGRRLDLQRLDLPDASFEVILSSHVLEHVADTGAALAELARVLSPGGRLFLQVPLLQGRTARPATPELHGDDTPVEWRFGWDLAAALRAAGFAPTPLAPAGWAASARAAAARGEGGEFDLVSLLADAPSGPEDLVEVLDPATSLRLGITPAHQFLTWECAKR
ncbi:MAG: class I SAM-dependent methyltransferase [Acidimicrobiales bacterium]